MKNKMTDNEIIKALECCKKDDCAHCPNTFENCYSNLAGFALDLINRQKAEIKELRKGLDIWTDIAHRETQYVEQAKTEAYKEFAERLKEKLKMPVGTILGVLVYTDEIDNLVKELSEVSGNA